MLRLWEGNKSGGQKCFRARYMENWLFGVSIGYCIIAMLPQRRHEGWVELFIYTTVLCCLSNSTALLLQDNDVKKRDHTAPSMGKIEIDFTVKSIICKCDWLLLILGTSFIHWHIICSCEKKQCFSKAFLRDCICIFATGNVFEYCFYTQMSDSLCKLLEYY